MKRSSFIPQLEFDRIWQSPLSKDKRIAIIADMCRLNALVSIKKAGSGHMGSTLSSLDIVTYLYYSEMNTVQLGNLDPNRDIYFSSKGHDVPGFYSVLYSLNLLSKEKLLNLRRIDGLCGHPDVNTPYVEVNSGSLGMGISKGKGIAWVKQYKKNNGRVIVMTGDGELQEGQNYEALMSAAHSGINNLIVIVDNNRVQTDREVNQICDYKDLESKFKVFGWHVERCDGHNFLELERAFRSFATTPDKPKALIADTIKGKGISFMEYTFSNQEEKNVYLWHSGAPNDSAFDTGIHEITERINEMLLRGGLAVLNFDLIQFEEKLNDLPKESISDAYGEAVLENVRVRKDIIVLDADLAADCRVRGIELLFPDQFIEAGIAEQDMVSMAGGIARQGLLPIVNSFGAFLASRANEQIYNNATEGTKIIYVCHYAGVIPAGPGYSHQSTRDISLFGALSNCEILQPCNEEETKMIVNYCINHSNVNCMIRLNIGPSPGVIKLPPFYELEYGCGFSLTKGFDALVISYGAILLNEVLNAHTLLQKDNINIEVVNMPWINRIDEKWLKKMVSPHRIIIVVDDHSNIGGLGDYLLSNLVEHNLLEGKQYFKIGIAGFPAWGESKEVLEFHGISSDCIVNKIKLLLKC